MENNFSIEWAVARGPEDQSRASNFALFTNQNQEKNTFFIKIINIAIFEKWIHISKREWTEITMFLENRWILLQMD